MSNGEGGASRWDLIAVREPSDGLLRLAQAISTDAKQPFGIRIGIVVSGATIRGSIVSPLTTAKAMDESIRATIDHLKFVRDDEVQITEQEEALLRDRMLGTVAGAFVQQGEAIVESRKRNLELLTSMAEQSPPVSYETFVAAAVENHYPSFIDLEDAELMRVDGSWLSLGNMRVRVTEIGAWWLIRTGNRKDADV